MSMNPYVNYSYGFKLYLDDVIIDSFAELFPELAEEYVDANGDMKYVEQFILELTETTGIDSMFPGLDVHTLEGNEILVVLREETRYLYDKYDAPGDGVFLPLEEKISKKSLKAFAKAFGLEEKPQPIIWTYWS